MSQWKYRAVRIEVMDVEEASVMDCFVQAGAELQRTQVAPEGDAVFCQLDVSRMVINF